MIDQLLILAEGGEHAEGISPFLVGGAMFALLLLLLGITYLFSGMNQRQLKKQSPSRAAQVSSPTERN